MGSFPERQPGVSRLVDWVATQPGAPPTLFSAGLLDTHLEGSFGVNVSLIIISGMGSFPGSRPLAPRGSAVRDAPRPFTILWPRLEAHDAER